MNRQFLAFLMISIMALTVCSAISVSAAPASAQPQQQTNTVQTSPSAYCTVHVGTNELWTGWQVQLPRGIWLHRGRNRDPHGEIGLQRALDESGVAGIKRLLRNERCFCWRSVPPRWKDNAATVAEPLADSRHHPDDRPLLLNNDQWWGSAPSVRTSRLVLQPPHDSICARADQLRRRHDRDADAAGSRRERDLRRFGRLRGSDTGIPAELPIGVPNVGNRQGLRSCSRLGHSTRVAKNSFVVVRGAPSLLSSFFARSFRARLRSARLLLSVWLEPRALASLPDDPVSIVVSLIITCVAQFTT